MIFIDKSAPISAKPNKVVATHDAMAIGWNVSMYGNASSVDFDSIFHYINAYMQTLPEPSQVVIANAYNDAKEAIATISDIVNLNAALCDIVETLYSVIDMSDVHDYVLNRSSIRIANSIKHTYEELEISNRDQSENDYKKKTYLFDEYVELLSLSLYIRPMVPIWAEYMARIDGEVNSNHKELYALALLRKTKLHTSPAYIRLSEYIETISIKSKSMHSAIIDSMGTSEVPTWRMANVLVRKLCVVNLSSTDDTSNIASIVYWCVQNLIKSIDRRYAGYVREKDKPSGSEWDEGDKSVVETYKIREELSDGDRIPISIYGEDALRVARDIDPTVPPEKVQLCHTALLNRTERMFCPWQENIMAWFIDKHMSCWSKDNISYKATMACLAATQATLWHWGHLHIALLLTATEERDAAGQLLGGIESKARISNDYVTRFKTIYPYYQAQVNSRTTDRQTNVGCKAVDSIATQLVRCDWRPCVPQELINDFEIKGVELNTSHGAIIVPADIRHLLSVMLDHLITHQETGC